MSKFCTQCGAQVAEGVRFCTNCGAQLASATTPQNAAPAAGQQQQQGYQRPAQQPQPQAQSRPQAQQANKRAQHMSEYSYDNDKGGGSFDWSQFKPKLEVGKPQITFISKGKLIAAGVFIIILIIVALLQGCTPMKETTTKTNNPTKKTIKISSNRDTNTAMLKSTGTNGVTSYTISDIDSKTLSRDDTRKLDALAKEIKAKGNCQVTVIGHADNTGTSEVNESVSVKRARLVADYLRKKGVSNITSSGESYNHPVAGNDTAAGRAKNRRVEIYVSTIGKYNPYK